MPDSKSAEAQVGKVVKNVSYDTASKQISRAESGSESSGEESYDEQPVVKHHKAKKQAPRVCREGEDEVYDQCIYPKVAKNESDDEALDEQELRTTESRIDQRT